MANTKNLQYALNERQKAYEELKKQNQIKADQEKAAALANKEAADRSAQSTYYGYINPYGLQSEALARSGLKNSGINQANMTRAFGGMQNQLGQSALQYAQSEADILAALNSANSAADRDWYDTRAQYYIDLYNLKNKRSSGGGYGSSGVQTLSNGASNGAIPKTLFSVGINPIDGTNYYPENNKKKNTTQNLLGMYGGDNWYNYF